MRNHRAIRFRRSGPLIAPLAWAAALLVAGCGSPQPQHALKRADHQARVGSVVTHSNGAVPLNLRWGELSAPQREVVRGWYVDMPAADEPPFPRDGLRPVLDAVWQGQQRTLASGDLVLLATVNGRGQVEEVKAYGATDQALVDFASRVLLQTPFKPALCAGTPCRMDFPVNLRLARE